MSPSAAISPASRTFTLTRVAQALMLSVLAVPVSAQSALPSVIFGAVNRVNSPEASFHPIFHLVPTGGAGLGVEYDSPPHHRWHTHARTIVTTKEYWSAELSTGLRGNHVQLEVYGRVREMSRLSFFGLGNRSEVGNHAVFRHRDPSVGALANIRAGWLSVGGRAETIRPEAGPGRSSSGPAIQELFGEAEAPGLIAQPRFGRYELSAGLDVPGAPGEAFYQGTSSRITYSKFEDQQLDRYTFHRLELEGRQRFALFHPLHRLTLHAWLSTTDTDAGQEVPFYFQRTLGGLGMVRGMHEELLGSDGTPATLRGFSSFRFRDRHLMLLQAEYRLPVFGPVDATLFADTGKVASRRGDLSFDDLKSSYGFSLSVMRGAATAVRADWGFGGGEGRRVLVSVGAPFMP